MDSTISKYFGSISENTGVLSQVYHGELISENNSDYIIPDYVSDADKILLCTATPKIEGRFITGDELEIEGSICFYLLLSTEGNTLSSLVYSEPFEVKTVVNGLSDDSFISIMPETDYVTSRLVNPRKVNIRSQVRCHVRVYENSHISPKIEGTESIDDEMNLQKHTEAVKTAQIFAAEEHDIKVSQDIELDSGYPQADEIILCRVTPSPCEVRTRDSEANIRTDMQIICIYKTDDGNYFCADKKITLEKTLNDLEQNVEWSARAVCSPVEANISSNAYGEKKIIELDFSYDLDLTAVKNSEFDVVCDMFSTEYECEPQFGKLPVTVYKRSYQTNMTVNSVIARSDSDAANVRSVFSGNVFLKDCKTNYKPEKNKLVAEGTAEITLVCENDALVENEPLFQSVSFPYEFKCEIDAGDDLLNCVFSSEITVTDMKFRADSQNLYADFEINVHASVFDENELNYLTSISVNKDTPAEHSNSTVTLYYPSDNETLWDIAKNYKITPESIQTANSLNSGNISGKKVLMIPKHYAKKGNIFNVK